jgi:NAD(P)-dependent dehydrogenase (short-subunit alcohol dehydrogenase family)
MDLQLSGRVAVVAGASRGIGRATALALAHEGCEVALIARDAAALELAAKEIRALGPAAALAGRPRWRWRTRAVRWR